MPHNDTCAHARAQVMRASPRHDAGTGGACCMARARLVRQRPQRPTAHAAHRTTYCGSRRQPSTAIRSCPARAPSPAAAPTPPFPCGAVVGSATPATVTLNALALSLADATAMPGAEEASSSATDSTATPATCAHARGHHWPPMAVPTPCGVIALSPAPHSRVPLHHGRTARTKSIKTAWVCAFGVPSC